MTKGTVVEVNVSELGMVTTGGKVVWAKYAQITNNPENDGCINAVLRESHLNPSCVIKPGCKPCLTCVISILETVV